MSDPRVCPHAPEDVRAMLAFLRSDSAATDDQTALARRLLAAEMAGFDDWRAEVQEWYIDGMRAQVRNLGIVEMPRSGFGHASVADHRATHDLGHIWAMRQYWYRLAYGDEYVVSDASALYDRSSLFLADCRMGRACVARLVREWEESRPDADARASALDRLLASLPNDNEEVLLPVLADAVQRHAAWIDIAVVRRHTHSLRQFAAFMQQWCDATPLARDEFAPLLLRLSAPSRMCALNCMMHLTGARCLERALIDWPCRDDVAFIVSLLGVLRPMEQPELLRLLFRRFIPLAPPDVVADEAYFDAYFAPILAAVAPAYVECAAASLLRSLASVPDWMTERCCQLTRSDQLHGPLRSDVHQHNATMLAQRERALVSRILNVAQLRADATAERADLVCTLCCDNRASVCFVPCGHILSCTTCFRRLPDPKRCPACRTRVLHAQSCFV